MKKEREKGAVQAKTGEMFLAFLKAGAFTIGGGYAMLPLVQEEFIKKKKWFDNKDFLEILGLAQSLPGPVIVNFSLLAGYRLKGFKGGLFSLLGAILPSFLIIMVIAVYLWGYGENRAVQAAFQGIRPAVVALIISAAIKLGKETFRQRYNLLFFLLFLGALLLFNVHPLVVIVAGALTGFLRPYFINWQRSTKE